FFQAEDGIRAFHVTGVQTCALPISAASEVIALHAACAKSAAATVGVRERRTSPPSCRRRGLNAAATCRRIHGRDAAWKERVVRRDRKSVVEGKRGGVGGSGMSLQNK